MRSDVTTTSHFVQALDRRGYRLHTGVPCSSFAGPIAQLTAERRYVPAANEGAALALAAGATAAGTPSVAYAQNSGFGNLLNPLTSLILPYRMPALVFMSLRGWPDPDADEPQHQVMGRTTHALLDTLQVPHWTLAADDGHDLEGVLDASTAALRQGRSAFVLVQPGAITGTPAGRTEQADEAALPSRRDGMKAVLARIPGALVVSTTGYTSRELFALGDSDHTFYMQGSMGHASAFGLGVALCAGGRRVVVLDGDGAALMHLGSMSTIGATAPSNLVHVIFDNRAYESTGRQPTHSSTVSFAGVGASVGYRTTVECRQLHEVEEAADRAVGTPGPHLIVVRTSSWGGAAPPRATSSIPAPRILSRFSAVASAGSTSAVRPRGMETPLPGIC
jgi:phosphonopyruvate decarboxylase